MGELPELDDEKIDEVALAMLFFSSFRPPNRVIGIQAGCVFEVQL